MNRENEEESQIYDDMNYLKQLQNNNEDRLQKAGSILSGNDPGDNPLGMMFPQNNVKEVIQEYTKEETTPSSIRDAFWGMHSNSLVWGFNDEASALDYKDNYEMARLWDIMSKPEIDFTWKLGQDLNQAEFMLNARINRSILRASGGINERMAEISQIQQSISSQHISEGRSGGSSFGDKFRDGFKKIIG